MIYLRQKYKEKPQAWGPVEAVQRSLRINSEKVGIDYNAIELAMPMWSPGPQKEYSKNNCEIVNISNPSYKNDYINFGSISSKYYLSVTNTNVINLPIRDEFSFFVINKPNFYQTSSAAVISWGGTDDLIAYPNDNNLPVGGCRIFWRNCGDNIINVSAGRDLKGKKHSLAFTSKQNIRTAYFNSDEIGKNTNSFSGAGTFNSFYIGGWKDKPQAFGGYIYELLLFSVMLAKTQIAVLSDYPYQLWQRQGDVYFSIPVSGGGTTYSEFISWKIKTLNEKQILWNILNNNTYNTSWKLFNTQETEISNKILTEDIIESAYSILNQSNKQTSWHIKSELNKETSWSILLSSIFTQDIKWKILNSNSKIIAYNILNKISKELSNKIFNIKETEISWKILISNLLSQDIEWKILNKSEKGIIWKILNTILNNSSWKLLSSSEKEIAWQITLTNFFTSDMSWKIFNTEYVETISNILKNSESITSWVIFNSEEISVKWNLLKTQDKMLSYNILKQTSDDFSWKIFNIHDHDLSWNIKKLSLLNNEWKIFNTEDLITRWSIISGIIPSSILDIIQESKNFSNGSKVFTQEPREFIFIQNKKTIIIL